jgi:hypothetical protein
MDCEEWKQGRGEVMGDKVTDHDTIQRRRVMAIKALASNLMRIASGGTAGDPFALLYQAIEYANAEFDGRNSGVDMMTDRALRDALEWQDRERPPPGMTPDQEYSHDLDRARMDIQNLALRIAAYSITGQTTVQYRKAENEFCAEIWRIADMRSSYAAR